MNIRQRIDTTKLLFDGAFGTYYSQKELPLQLPEKANLNCQDGVKGIHKEYIEAGADIIRTNTFAANRGSLDCSEEEQKEILIQGVKLAQEAVRESGKEVFVAASIGPIPEAGQNAEKAVSEYMYMSRTLIEAGAEILLFETFPDYHMIMPVIMRIKEEKPEVFIMVHFCTNQYGYTNSGIGIKRIFRELGQNPYVDGIGLNCGVGPGHLLQLMRNLYFAKDKFYAALPNASYPKMMQNRLVFLENKEYFIEKIGELCQLGIDFPGGCCGTTPEYIRLAAKEVGKYSNQKSEKEDHKAEQKEEYNAVKHTSCHGFYQGNSQTDSIDRPGLKEKLIAVEIAPPFGADEEKILDATNYLKKYKVDAVTFPDSPSGRTRADSILTAVKAMEQTGLCVMPHVCCRDKNAIAIRSQLLGAYMNGVRNLLIVTGDPVPTLLRKEIKSVYNFDSIGFMRILQEMNEEEFAADPMVYGGALNPNRRNLHVEVERMKKKIEAGASFFLTQPLFTEEDIAHLRQLHDEVPARILCGIMPLVSRKNAIFIKNEMAGIHITDDIVSRYDQAATREQGEGVGVSIAKEIMEKTAEFVDGYYFSIPFNRVYLLKDILQA